MSLTTRQQQTLEWLAEIDSKSATTTTGTAYRLGKLDRATRHYQPVSMTGDGAVLDSGDLMHRRITDAARNNSQVRRLSNVIPNLLVGTGIQTLADPFEPWVDINDLTPDDLDQRLSYALESDEVFSEWWLDASQFSVDGRLSGPDMDRLIAAELVRTGSCLIVESASRGKVPLSYQLLEAEQLDRSRDQQAGENGNRIVGGIEQDRTGRAVAYWIFDDHPADPFATSMVSRRILANRVIYCQRPDRPSDHLGATWLAAVGQEMIDRQKFLTTELATAAKAAALCFVHKKRNPHLGSLGLDDSLSTEDDAGNEVLKMSSSPQAATIGTDEDLAIVESQRPTASAEPFLKVLDRATAGGAGVSYYSLTGDYASTNFSSARAAKLDEDQQFAPLQQWFARLVSIPIRRRFNALAVATGQLSTVTAREFAANPQRYQRFEALTNGRELLDPESETNAAISRLRSGLSTLKIECGKRGLHWVRVLRQIALENHVTSVLGVVLDFSKGQGGQVTQTTRATQTETTPTTEPAG